MVPGLASTATNQLNSEGYRHCEDHPLAEPRRCRARWRTCNRRLCQAGTGLDAGRQQTQTGHRSDEAGQRRVAATTRLCQQAGLRGCEAGLHRGAARRRRGQERQGRDRLGPDQVRFHRARQGNARYREPESLANEPAAVADRAIQDLRQDLPGARLRPLSDHVHRGHKGRHRRGSIGVCGDGERRAGALPEAPRGQARDGRDLHPQPC